MTTIPYLNLEKIKRNLKVEKLLPQDIAYQCHALPVSCEGNRIIVAISYPEDKTVISMVTSVIGFPVSFVQADVGEIDHRLEEVWHHSQENELHLLLWSASQAEPGCPSYAEGIADLLRARLYQVDSRHFAEDPWRGFQQSIDETQPDLIFLDDLDSFSSGKRPRRSVTRRLIRNTPISMLIPNQPLWPLRKILLVLSESDPVDDPAIEWVGKLAQTSKAEVEILVFLPPVPMMYGQAIQYSIPNLLRSNDPLGKKAQWVSDQFTQLGIEGTFRLRQGDPENQIRSEISNSSPDMVIVSEESQNLAHRLLTTDVTNSLIKFADCPVLFARKKRDG